MLTTRQTEIVDFILEFSRRNCFPPTYEEIRQHFGFRSSNAATEHVAALEKKGVITRRAGLSRSIVVNALAKPVGAEGAPEVAAKELAFHGADSFRSPARSL